MLWNLHPQHSLLPAVQVLPGDWLQSSKDPSLQWPAVYLGNMQVNVGERQICVVDVLRQCLVRMERYLEQFKPLNTLNNSIALSSALSAFCLQVWARSDNRRCRCVMFVRSGTFMYHSVILAQTLAAGSYHITETILTVMGMLQWKSLDCYTVLFSFLFALYYVCRPVFVCFSVMGFMIQYRSCYKPNETKIKDILQIFI